MSNKHKFSTYPFIRGFVSILKEISSHFISKWENSWSVRNWISLLSTQVQFTVKHIAAVFE